MFFIGTLSHEIRRVEKRIPVSLGGREGDIKLVCNNEFGELKILGYINTMKAELVFVTYSKEAQKWSLI